MGVRGPLSAALLVRVRILPDALLVAILFLFFRAEPVSSLRRRRNEFVPLRSRENVRAGEWRTRVAVFPASRFGSIRSALALRRFRIAGTATVTAIGVPVTVGVFVRVYHIHYLAVIR